MTPDSTSFLPSEAVRVILGFMTRKQLITLSGVNRQFLHITDSPHFETKPLLIAQSLIISRCYTHAEKLWNVTIDYHNMRGLIAVSEVATWLEQVFRLQWMRFEGRSDPPS